MRMTEAEFALVRATAATVIELLERDNLYTRTWQHLKDLVLAAEVDRMDPAEPRPKLGAAARKAIVFALRSIVSEISEREYSAGWYTGVEWLVWKAITENRLTPHSWITQDEAEALLELSGMIDGWVRYEGFVPMHEWLEVVERKRVGGIDA